MSFQSIKEDTMRNSLLIIFLSLFLTIPYGITKEYQSIVEENDLWIGVDQDFSSNITKEKFNQILDRVNEIYAPIVETTGNKLVVVRKWEDGTVNAYANRSGNNWMITMFGGLARHEAVTADAFALVACHELGHHLGGLPKKKIFFFTLWAANEGQSDYWGVMKCLRKYFEKDDNKKIISEMQLNEYAVTKCNDVFGDEEDAAICIRSAMAGLSLANLFKVLKNLEVPLKFETPDTTVVSQTNHSHPAPQCRLDTYFSAALCEKDAYDDVSETDINQGLCARRDGYTIGSRPFCWYKP